ncbi:MAG TPA: fimbrial protein [Scandinavium sp.]|jgi:type 1 fimbria pilin
MSDKNYRYGVMLCVLLKATSALAGLPPTTNVDIIFEAKITTHTCNITIEGAAITAGSDGNYTLAAGKNDGEMGVVEIDKIVSGSTEADTDFKLVAKGCPQNISQISTRISGDSINNDYISPKGGEGSTTNIGVGFYRTSDMTTLIKLNTDRALLWNADEIENGVNMKAALRAISRTLAVKEGDFNATATLSFSYE